MSRELIEALMRLEAAAAAVGHLLPADDPELLQEIAAGFGPLRPKGYSISRWHQFWLHWLQSSAALHPCATSSIPPESGCDWTVSSGLIDNPSS